MVVLRPSVLRSLLPITANRDDTFSFHLKRYRPSLLLPILDVSWLSHADLLQLLNIFS